MRSESPKYGLLGLFLASIYWLVDSSIHRFLYGEGAFELIPSEMNELWMRIVIAFLITAFGGYVDISVRRLKQLYDEKYQLQLERDQALTKLLSGYVSICSICKKVRTDEEHGSDDMTWESIESYISRHTEMRFSHGYCEECGKNLMRDMHAEDT